MHIKDHNDAMKFFRTYDNVASKGKWKEFVDEMEFESMLQEPRTMAQEPRNMADGGRIGFDNGGTSKIKTDKFKHSHKFFNTGTGKMDVVYKDAPVDYSKRAKRASTKVDLYKDAIREFTTNVDEAFDSNNVSKLPKSFAQFLKDKSLKDGTYHHLVKTGQLPKFNTDIAKLRLEFANKLIHGANNQLKFIDKETLFKNAGFTDADYKKVFSMKSGKLITLDSAPDKVRKAYRHFFQNPEYLETSYNHFFNPRELLSKTTGLDVGTVSRVNLKDVDPFAYEVYKRLGNADIQKILDGDVTQSFFGSSLEDLKKYINEDIAKGKKPFQEYMDAGQAKSAATRKGRLAKAAQRAGESVVDINKGQDEAISLLNKFYKENPKELLGNTKLRNLLDLTLKDGEIVKKNKYVTDDDFLKLIKEKPGLFTKDHVDEVQFEKLSTEFPVFKQLATYNTNSGLIKSMKAYINKNQNSKDTKVQNKIKKQIEFLEDLKLRIDTPTGRVGSKEVLAAVDRKAGTLPNFLAQLKALNIKLPAKAKAAVLGISGGLGAATLAAAGPIEETGTTALDTAKIVGGTTAGALGVGTKTGRKLLGKAFNLGTGPAGMFALNYGLGVDPTQTVDRIGLEAEVALAPTLVKGATSVTEKIKNPLLRKGLETLAGVRIPGIMNPANALRISRMASPIGLLSLAGEGIYHAGKKEMAKREQMNPEELKQYMLKNQSRGWAGGWDKAETEKGIMTLKKKR